MDTIFENDLITVKTNYYQRIWNKYGKVRVYLNGKHHLELTEMSKTGEVEVEFRHIPPNWSLESGDGWLELSHQYSDNKIRVERR